MKKKIQYKHIKLRNPKKLILGLLLASIFLNSFSQSVKVSRDLQLWTGASIEKQMLDKKLGLQFQSELRLEKDMSRMKSAYAEFGVDYSIIKQVKLGTTYRIVQSRKRNGDLEMLYRYNIDLVLKQKINRLTPSYRFRFQNTDNDFFNADENKDSRDVVRNRIMLKYNIRKSRFSPLLSGELFSGHIGKQFENYKFRSTIGSYYQFKRVGEIKFFYSFTFELNNPRPYYISVVGVRYKYSF